MKKGEIKPVVFKYYDKDGDPIDVTGATFELEIKSDADDSTPLVEFLDVDFTHPNNYSAQVTIDTTDSNLVGGNDYVLDVKAAFGGDTVDITETIKLRLGKAITT
jgi:hypothetical protein